MHLNNEKSSKKRNITILFAVAIVIAALIATGNFLLQSQRDHADTIRPASLALSCSVDTPEEELPKSVKEGDSGTCVTTIRELLEAHGVTSDTPVSAEAVFDEQLTALVKRFQADHYLVKDGAIGAQTWPVLRNVPMNREEPSESETPTESEEPSATSSPSESSAPSSGPVQIPGLSPEPSDFASPHIELTPIPPSPKPQQPKPLPSVPTKPDTQPDFEIRAKAYDRFTGPNTTDSVVLTYDDCPTTKASFIETIEAANNIGVSLVLAPTSECIGKELFDVDMARSKGHVVINHSIVHESYLDMKSSAIVEELRHKNFSSNFGRPPFGAGGFNETKSKKVVDAFTEANMRMWLWSNDTEDWGGKVDGVTQKPKTTAAIVKHINQTAQPGDTILMHMQHNGFNPQALGEIVDTLEANNLTVCKNSHRPMPQYPTASNICR